MKAQALAQFALLSELESEELDALCEVLEPQELARGSILFEEGDPADGLVLIAEGRLRIKCLRAGDLGEIGEGEVIGASSLAGPGSRETTAVAVSNARVYTLSRDGFQSLVRGEPRVACKIAGASLRALADTLREGLTPLVAAHG